MPKEHQCHCASGSGAAMPAARPMIRQIVNPQLTFFTAPMYTCIARALQLADELEATLTEDKT